MRAVAGLLAGPRADALCAALLAAETDPVALDLAADELDLLAPLDMRRILASYGKRAAPPPALANPHSILIQPDTRHVQRKRLLRRTSLVMMRSNRSRTYAIASPGQKIAQPLGSLRSPVRRPY